MAPWSSDTTTRTIIASALPMNATLEGLAAQVASLQATVDALVATPALPAAAANTWWLLSNGILVFFMQVRCSSSSERGAVIFRVARAATHVSTRRRADVPTRLFTCRRKLLRICDRAPPHVWCVSHVFSSAQCGFGMLEAGSVTARATQNILLKNLMDTCIGCVMWWIAGYGIGTRRFQKPSPQILQ